MAVAGLAVAKARQQLVPQEYRASSDWFVLFIADWFIHFMVVGLVAAVCLTFIQMWEKFCLGDAANKLGFDEGLFYVTTTILVITVLALFWMHRVPSYESSY
jgi:hypothetical protein